jgi:hypothetical protein
MESATIPESSESNHLTKLAQAPALAVVLSPEPQKTKSQYRQQQPGYDKSTGGPADPTRDRINSQPGGTEGP